MSNKKKYDIHERIFHFIVDVIKFVERLPRTSANIAIINQIIPSVTSMGANDQEADGAATRKEFVHRYSIVRKEGKETNFWLRLIGALNSNKKDKAEIL
jgi:four helix bundle protein